MLAMTCQGRGGGIVKAEGLGDGPLHRKFAIAQLRLTMPLGMY